MGRARAKSGGGGLTRRGPGSQVMAGLYIGTGAFLTFMVGGLLPSIDSSDPGLQNILLGAFGLPFGLLMVVLTGADRECSSTGVGGRG